MKYVLCSLCFICIALGSVWYAGKLNNSHKIVLVDTKKVISHFIHSEKYQNIKGEEFANQSEVYFKKLDSLLQKLSIQENLIIMPKPAVIAGATDITQQVIELLESMEEAGR